MIIIYILLIVLEVYRITLLSNIYNQRIILFQVLEVYRITLLSNRSDELD